MRYNKSFGQQADYASGDNWFTNAMRNIDHPTVRQIINGIYAQNESDAIRASCWMDSRSVQVGHGFLSFSLGLPLRMFHDFARMYPEALKGVELQDNTRNQN